MSKLQEKIKATSSARSYQNKKRKFDEQLKEEKESSRKTSKVYRKLIVEPDHPTLVEHDGYCFRSFAPCDFDNLPVNTFDGVRRTRGSTSTRLPPPASWEDMLRLLDRLNDWSIKEFIKGDERVKDNDVVSYPSTIHNKHNGKAKMLNLDIPVSCYCRGGLQHSSYYYH